MQQRSRTSRSGSLEAAQRHVAAVEEELRQGEAEALEARRAFADSDLAHLVRARRKRPEKMN